MEAATCLGLRKTRGGREFSAFGMSVMSSTPIQTTFDFEAACKAAEDQADAEDYLLAEAEDIAVPPPPVPCRPTPTPSPPPSSSSPGEHQPQQRPHSSKQEYDKRRKLNHKGKPVETKLVTEDLPHPKTAYMGPHKPQYTKARGKTPKLGSTGPECLRTAAALGYQTVRLEPGESAPFLDSKGRVWGVALRGHAGQIPPIAPILHSIRRDCTSPQRTTRGEFDAYAYGFSYGGGQKMPTNFRNTLRSKSVLQDAFSQAPLRHLLRFANGAFQTWLPLLHKYYREALGCLTKHYPGLQKPSDEIPYPAFTFNISLQSICGSHRDSCNDITGPCWAEADGRFNWLYGGHLVLHDAKLVIEMSPGTMVFFPSAVITHEVIPVAPGEIRMSITGYMAGGLFRHIDQGMATAPKGKPTKEEAARRDAAGAARWEAALKRFMTIPELLNHHSTAAASSRKQEHVQLNY